MTEFKMAPSILSADFSDLAGEIRKMEAGQAELIHFDVMDGTFVPEVSFGQPVLRCMKKRTSLLFDVHLMTMDPIRQVRSFAEAGADIITFHLEACDNADEVIDLIHACGKKASVSVKPGTPVEALYPWLGKVEMILLMTVEPGFGGQAFIPESLQRIRTLRSALEERGLKTDIEVDGGINAETIRAAYEAGANVFVSGSALFKGDFTANIQKMRALLK